MYKSEKGKKVCSNCGHQKAFRQFYKSQSPLFADGYVSMCKLCLFEGVDEENLEESLKSILMKIDKPFLYEVWESTLEKEEDNPVGVYIKNINSLPQYRRLTYKDSVYEDENEARIKEHNKIKLSDDSIQIDDKIRLKWGLGYSDLEYAYLEKFYKDMMDSHDIKTPQHVKNLISIAKNYLDLDKLQAQGDWSNLEKLARIQEKLLASSGFRPIDRKGGDEATGLRSFSAVWAEVENKGFVPPHDVTLTQDVLDKTIMYMQNFTLKLLNQAMLTSPMDDTPNVDGDDQ
ncbi:hypothetical protein CON15_20060 [Bacillus cereus]|uniref:Uncharacterized protein n=2 Tax=Bacillus thuringiensis TaxID=1428 RepID=A0AB36VF93_BACTU|nr:MULTISPECIES: hypothetical protein [Bacillus cereus group]MEB9467789.1 hypothetical protein [Bacillus cereus]MEC0031193.1 hypothetical protein [Bacillus cereus]OUA16675.1 hypothetical protein BK776_30425 [Bacillus thuringiensis serovar aizawai]PDZ55821.1 hypothetical protein CON15_20060 [Bacillus cereus]PFC28593.1 hypothetical protein CN299_20275 [Bacillus thuringiensis]